MDFLNEEIPKYKKKKNGKSKSNRRSSHKHEYELIIMPNFLMGYGWCDRCKICGRLREMTYSKSLEGMRRPKSGKYISSADYYTAKELHKMYPNVNIYRFKKDNDRSYSYDPTKLEKIIFTEEGDEH